MGPGAARTHQPQPGGVRGEVGESGDHHRPERGKVMGRRTLYGRPDRLQRVGPSGEVRNVHINP